MMLKSRNWWLKRHEMRNERIQAVWHHRLQDVYYLGVWIR